jgi:hypothetical protein
VAFSAAVVAGLLSSVNVKGEEMSYGEARSFLKQHTKVIELSDGQARVAVCPEWQGRVMTSACGGPEGLSFGYLHTEFIEAGKPDRQFSNYGAEDRMWLSPEGGQFSLWFAPGAEQNLDNWFTAPALNEGAFEVVGKPSDESCRMARRMQLQNASATKFDLDATREVRLLDNVDLCKIFGPDADELMSAPGVKKVAYETVNTITNRGEPMTKEKGLVSIWMLGMMNAAPQTVVIVPYKPGPESELGPVVKSDYFGQVPPERLKITPEAILFLGDNKYRSKIGTSQRRAKNVLGSIDFTSGTLTLVQFTMPDDPGKCDYMNNMWELPQKDPYHGDVANSYNDGPPAPGKKGLGAFYEIESLSPARELTTGQSLTHSHRTVHVQADAATLAKLARLVLGVELDKVRQTMFPR